MDSTDADAWLVDGFGGAHPISAKTGIGRSHDNELIVLASSVSREHAVLHRTETGWTVSDLNSRNGTFVNVARCQGQVGLSARALLRVGDVLFWFLSEIAQEPTRRPAMTTDGTRGGLVRYLLARGDQELCIVSGDNDAAAGALLWRAVGTESWSERSLAPLEFQLLRALCIRAHDEASSPSAIRGCVPTKQLVNDLPFQSKYANQENVRQVVLRLRAVLTEVGVAGLLAVAPGRGYYIACPVTVGITSLTDAARR